MEENVRLDSIFETLIFNCTSYVIYVIDFDKTLLLLSIVRKIWKEHTINILRIYLFFLFLKFKQHHKDLKLKTWTITFNYSNWLFKKNSLKSKETIKEIYMNEEIYLRKKEWWCIHGYQQCVYGWRSHKVGQR